MPQPGARPGGACCSPFPGCWSSYIWVISAYHRATRMTTPCLRERVRENRSRQRMLHQVVSKSTFAFPNRAPHLSDRGTLWGQLLCSSDLRHGEPSETEGAPRPKTTGSRPDSALSVDISHCGAVAHTCVIHSKCWRTNNTACNSRMIMCHDSRTAKNKSGPTTAAVVPGAAPGTSHRLLAAG